MSYGVVCRRGWDPVLLWLWLWPASTDPVRLLAWEPPYAATGVALQKAKRLKKKITKQIKCLPLIVLVGNTRNLSNTSNLNIVYILQLYF